MREVRVAMGKKKQRARARQCGRQVHSKGGGDEKRSCEIFTFPVESGRVKAAPQGVHEHFSFANLLIGP